MNKEEYIDNILLENNRLYNENKELHNKIDKAIEKLIEDIKDLRNFDDCFIEPPQLIKALNYYIELLKDSDVDG